MRTACKSNKDKMSDDALEIKIKTARRRHKKHRERPRSISSQMILKSSSRSLPSQSMMMIFISLALALLTIDIDLSFVNCQQPQPLTLSGATPQQYNQQANSVTINNNQLLVNTLNGGSALLSDLHRNQNQHHHYQSHHQNLNIAQHIQPSQFIPQSLPLTRSTSPFGAQQQGTDLENAIVESTTASQLLSTLSIGNRPTSSSSSFQLIQHASAVPTCQLPPTWAGKWYQSNKEPIRVTNTEISDKGICRDKKGDKYLFEYSKQHQQSCLVCLVINERHLNVLQYKESTCQPIPPQYLNRTTNQLIIETNAEHALLDSICSDITGDAQLESLFRLDTPAIECPISGKYNFQYDSCTGTNSSLDSCIDKKQLNFKFSACPDVIGSESKSEVLRCYADWSEGNNFYMIGRIEHASNHQDKGKFRCFVYERAVDGGILMAQSLEESCYGLINANEGPKTMRLTVKPPTSHKCHFPSYIQSQSENWLSVDNSLIYMFNQNSTKYQVKETKEGNIIEEAICLQQLTIPATAATQSSQAHPHSLQQPPHLHHNHARSNNQQAQQGTTSRRYPPSSLNQVDRSFTQARTTVNDHVYLIQITKNW